MMPYLLKIQDCNTAQSTYVPPLANYATNMTLDWAMDIDESTDAPSDYVPAVSIPINTTLTNPKHGNATPVSTPANPDCTPPTEPATPATPNLLDNHIPCYGV